MAQNFPKISDIKKVSSNGCTVAKCIPRGDTCCRQTSSYIAAIDFGTTNCSVAYIHPGETSDQEPKMIPIDAMYRVPTAILFNSAGEVTHFGTKARKTYRNLGDEDRLHWAYFEHIKMDLQHDESINREMTVKAMNGKEYYLVEVIAHVLKYLKDALIKKMERSNWKLEATAFDWVITVPAIWRARGKQMMREAGYKAGLCSMECCPALQVASNHNPEEMVEDNSDKLSLAFEPESAAFFCQNMSQRQTASFCRGDTPFSASSYLVVDIGGGTVDISAHRLTSNPEPHISVIHPPEGNDFGGTRINAGFSKYLQKLVADTGFSRFLPPDNDVMCAKNSLYLNELLNENFEKQKIMFAEESTDNNDSRLMIELPFQFMKCYLHDLNEGVATEGESMVQLVGHDLRISQDLMETFFKPVTKGILKCINDILANLSNIEKIYLVGGFGGCRYIHRCIKNEFDGRGLRYVIPVEPAYAVVRGAALFKQNPTLVESRRADATYGFATNGTFIDGLHDPKYQRIDDDGKRLCRNLFTAIVERGDIVRSGEVYQKTVYPIFHKQTGMRLKFYSSQEKDVFYVTGEVGRKTHRPDCPTVTQIGEVKIDMPDLTGDKNRAVDVIFDFSHTEIQVKAFDQTSKNEVKIVLDFLTCS